jgi:hypothetical protein
MQFVERLVRLRITIKMQLIVRHSQSVILISNSRAFHMTMQIKGVQIAGLPAVAVRNFNSAFSKFFVADNSPRFSNKRHAPSTP